MSCVLLQNGTSQIEIRMLRRSWSYAPYSLFELWTVVLQNETYQSQIQIKLKDTKIKLKLKLYSALRLTTFDSKCKEIILILNLNLHIEIIRGASPQKSL
jgi:hypothetical protein